jgi:hypothetical protein
VWKAIRIGLLLIVLAAVALNAWLDRVNTQSWQETLWVGIFPLNAEGTPAVQRYIADLTAQDFAGLEEFFVREGHRYGVHAEQPVHIELYPEVQELPPALPREAGPVATAWWSLKMRLYAARAAEVPGRAPSRIRLFVLYHDPAILEHVPDSHGLQKGLVGVVHAFATPAMAGGNNIVIAHELLHTVGATDKYDLASGEPLNPGGLADPGREPLYPQERAEIMAGRRALSAQESEMPRSLKAVVVGPDTAHEIRWTR